jgi:integrase
MALSNVKIKGAGTKDKSYKLFDSGGLYIEVMPTGKKLWRLKYYYLKKEKRISFGAYPLVSLAEARDARDDAKRLLIKGIDPSQAKKDKKIVATRNAENTFKAVALEWLDVRSENWTQGYRDKLLLGLERNIFPSIGDQPIADITPPVLLSTLRKIEGRGAYDTAQRIKSTCSRIFQYGISISKCEWDAAQNLKGALKSHKTEHFRTLELKALPDFLKALERNEARIYERTRRAVWLSLFTFCRPQEIRMAKWEHIDFDNALWTIPAELMKMRKDHIVPLSSQVIDILKSQREELNGVKTEWVFPSQVRLRNPMSD